MGKDLSEQNITNIVAVLFMWTVVVAYSASAYIPAILMERPLFIRERSDGLFRVVTYLGFKLLEEFSVQFILCLPISAMVFYPLELSGSWALFWLVYYFTTLVGISLGYFIAALSPNMDVANAALPLFITIFLFFTGLLIRWVDTPWYWRWVGYVNFLRYSWGALMINQFQGANAIYLGSEVRGEEGLGAFQQGCLVQCHVKAGWAHAAAPASNTLTLVFLGGGASARDGSCVGSTHAMPAQDTR